jgi:hypothetical protein
LFLKSDEKNLYKGKKLQLLQNLMIEEPENSILMPLESE